MKVLAYARVSTEDQAVDGSSLDAQRRRLESFAAATGLEIVETVTDAGVSAKTLDRPGLARVLELLDDHQAEGVLVAKLDRLSRSLADWQDLIDRYFGPERPWQLLSVSDSIDTRTAAGRLTLNLLFAVAQWEREAIAERTREVLRHLRSQRRPAGVPLYGTRLDPATGTVVDDDQELATLARIRELAASGLSLRRLGRVLESEGRLPRSGRAWQPSVLRSLIQRDPPPCPPPLPPSCSATPSAG